MLQSHNFANVNESLTGNLTTGILGLFALANFNAIVDENSYYETLFDIVLDFYVITTVTSPRTRDRTD